ncbi:methyl-accepting chemotaxis protein [Ascidiaceihabitans sp.]|uniref:methyl-accepting chemotaxis protein n=1 Tax=Ascidiaceihabitans sp. TaxID=1872644 RepID=UPI0032972AC0
MIFGKRAPQHNPETADALALCAALHQSHGMMTLDLDGTVLDANQVTLDATGYTLEELKGQNHRIFVAPDEVDGPDYSVFWENLRNGEPQSGSFSRKTKNGKNIWIDASYHHLSDPSGVPDRIVEIATDVTANKIAEFDATTQLEAISNSLVVIEFDLDGTILTANDNFLKCTGYSLEQVQGKNYNMFVEDSEHERNVYKALWDNLGDGKSVLDDFMRISSDGSKIWVRTMYNPIVDTTGRPVKVVALAADVTENKIAATDADGKLSAISRSQIVVEFDLDGKVIWANDNFLAKFGHSADNVIGKHHRIFVDKQDAETPEYAAFWRDLARGRLHSGQYKRIAGDGAEIWIQASYNPIFDLQGKPYKVVKYAFEVTENISAMNALVAGLASLSEGDLTARLPADLSGPFEGLRDTFNNTLVRLEELVSGILTASQAIATETNSIAENASNLSLRGEQQAATVEETSASMEEISATVSNTVDNAKIATQAAKTAAQQAQSGGDIVTNAVEAMSRIETSTQEISKIVEVIDGIAFQTNLLALNAGVEAARAGDAGRGFAVVASEVRALAHRSSDSAREINELITKSNEEVLEGSELVNSSGEALTKIVSGVTAVVDNINEILEASQEQAAGITEVTQAMLQIDQTTQHTAGLADKSATAAKQLAERAANLRELVSFFGHGPLQDINTVEVVEDRPIETRTSALTSLDVAVGDVPQSSVSKVQTRLTPSDGWEEF